MHNRKHGNSDLNITPVGFGAWTLRLPAVTGAIVGARNARQAEGVMSAGEFTLSHQDIAEIEGAVAVAQAAC